MSTLTPPIALEHPANQNRVDYIQDVASQHDFDYPPVGRSLSERWRWTFFMLEHSFSYVYTLEVELIEWEL